MNKPLGGGVGWGGSRWDGVINIIRSHEMKSLWLELFIHRFLEEQREAGHREEAAGDPLDNKARNRLHLSCHAMEMISLAVKRSS